MWRRRAFLLPLLLPPLLIAGALHGGWGYWWPALLVFGLVPLLDLVTGRDSWNPNENESLLLENDPYYRNILLAWVPLQFAVLVFAVWQAGRVENAVEFAGLVVSTGVLTGGIGITIAHEFGHKLNKADRSLCRLLLMSVCYMHFHIEHNKGHHARVATPDDPATAREGQSIYAFLPQTLIGSFASAWRIEAERLKGAGLRSWSVHNHVLLGAAGSLAMLVLAALAGGAAGLLLFAGQSVVAILLLEIVNYVEHYGLRRESGERGYERVSVQHSWNASQRLTNAFLFNLQRHSHHHVAHHRRYQVLKHFEESPQLPTGYAGMVLLALIPPLWKRVMDRRLHDWRGNAS